MLLSIPLARTPRRVIAACLWAILAATPACGPAPQSQTATPPPSPPAGETASEAEATEAAAEAPAPALVITPFGVPECDNYVKQFISCVESRVSEAQRENLIASFEANRKKWRALATMREGALALGVACRAAAQKSKEELTVDYGCEF